MRAERHPREAERIEALEAYEILDTPREAEFDDLVALASRICETPVALVTLLDRDRQWFKAALGVDVPERPYEESLCSHAILERGIIEVPDLTRDARFADNAIVAGEPNLRFYAGVPLESPEGLPIGTLCVIDVRPRELTDLQRDALRVLGRQAMTQLELRRRLREQERERQEVQETLAQAEIGTWRFDRTTETFIGNPVARRFYGALMVTPAAQIAEAIHPDDRAVREAAQAAAIRTGGAYEVEYRATGADGLERWILARGESRGKTLAGVAIDITQRRRAELALAQTQSETDRTLELAGVATWAWDAGADHVRTNRLLRHFFGIPAEETRNLPLFEFLKAIHPDDRTRVSDEIAAALEGAPFETEYRVLDAEGSERWVLARGGRSEGTTTLAGVLVDVTARKRAEADLEAERRQFRRLLDEVPAHVVTMQGKELRYDFVNRAFMAFVGMEDGVVGTCAGELWDTPAEHLAMLRGILETGEPVSGAGVPVISPEGVQGYYDFSFQPLRDPDSTVIGLFVHSLDVTERIRTQEALVQSEERFRAAQETTPDAFSILEAVRDDQGEIVDFCWAYSNPAAERMAERPANGLVGERLLELRPWSREIGMFDGFVAVVETGKAVTRELPIRKSTEQGFVRMTAVKVGDGIAASFTDITDRVLAEESLREAVAERTKELREAFEEAERFNYSISHDLRTPLRAMAATAQILLEEAGEALDETHRELLERQGHNARRLGLLIDQLLKLSRLGRVEMARSPLDMTALARAVADEIAQAGVSPCAIDVQSGMKAEGDPALVRLVFGNLLENACKFSCGDGRVRVSQEGNVFAVSDEGVGFDMKYAAKLFLPFERLVGEQEFPGTGIGLANVERIVRRHGGRVWAESEPGKGATFFFTLGTETSLPSGGEG